LIVDNRYEIIIFWSDEDRAFLADVPELPGCMAHGASHEEALKNAQEAIQLWIEAAEEDSRAIPQPKGRRLVYAWNQPILALRFRRPNSSSRQLSER
jgi:predicted RNase H-like HicB family nuclease